MTAVEWGTLANLATALGTLILAVATFAAVRSSNLTARVAQQLLVDLRPVLSVSRREDPDLKVNFGDSKWVRIPGGGAVAEVGAGDGSAGAQTPVVYLAIGLRNAGNGIAVLQGWRFYPATERGDEHAPLEEFQQQNRDLYIPVGTSVSGRARSATPGPPGTATPGPRSRPTRGGRSTCSTPTTRAASWPSAGSGCCRRPATVRTPRQARPGSPRRASIGASTASRPGKLL